MVRRLPFVADQCLHMLEGTSDPILVGSEAWYCWLAAEQHPSFAFSNQLGTFTVRRERRRQQWYWYLYHKQEGKLRKAYLGKTEEMSLQRLNAIAATVVVQGDLHAVAQAHVPAPSSTLDGSDHPRATPLPLRAAFPGSEHTPAHNLPAPLTLLIGREHEVAAVCTLLRHPEIRLVTLTGTGGIGKTRLALQVATDLLADFADGVCFVELAPVSDPDLVVPTIVQTLGLKDTGGQPLLKLLSASLSGKHLLLLLDNFEQVLAAAPQLSELLIACPHLKLLVTSRAVLHLRGEHEFPVPPLALPDLTQHPEPETLAQVAAVALFLQRAWATNSDLQLTAPNARAIAQICVQLDGLPLAIELAAARSKLLPPQALLARLGQRLAILTSGSQDAPVRQQTLRNTIQWSYDLLDAQQQRLFRWLSVFVRGCTLEALEAVGTALGYGVGQVLDGVASLIDKSLLRQTEQEDGEPRFMMLETIREYGLEALEASGEMLTTREIHARYYSRLAKEAEPELVGPQQTRWLERLEREHNNLRAALSWLLEPKAAEEVATRTELALRLVTALHLFWISHAHMNEGMAFLERVLAASAGAAPALRAKALAAAADLAGAEEYFQRQEELAAEGLVLCREVGDKAGTAFCLYTLGEVAWIRCEYARACSLLEESVALERELGNKHRLGWSLSALANTDLDQGEYLRARSRYEEALALFRELGDKQGIAGMLFLLALLRFYLEDALTARLLAEEALGLCKELGIKWLIALLFYLLGEIALSKGDLVTASQLAQEALELNRELGRKVSITNSLSLAARVHTRQGNYAAARRLTEESLILAREVDDLRDLPFYLEGLAEVVAAQGEGAWAARLWGAAEALRDALGAPIPPVYRPTYERAVTAARAQFGEKPFAAAWDQGRTMTLEHVLAPEGPVTMLPPISTGSVTAPPIPKSSTAPEGLTAREVEVLRFVAQGLADAQIAEQLVISPHTVNTHLKSIYGKLQVTSRSAATRYALEHHLL